jgi:hypothetical protein
VADTELKDTEEAVKGNVCPECAAEGIDKRYRMPMHLATHRNRSHGVPLGGTQPRDRTKKPPPHSAGGAKAGELNRLRRELKKDVSALCILPFMAKGTAANLAMPGVSDMIDEKAGTFADAWVTVAEQNDWVRVNLSRVLEGGIWLNAAAQTAALGYCVAVLSGSVPLHPGALMLMPEMRQFVQQTPPADQNGHQPPPDPADTA